MVAYVSCCISVSVARQAFFLPICYYEKNVVNINLIACKSNATQTPLIYWSHSLSKLA